MMYNHSMQEMNSPFAIAVSPQFDKNVDLTIQYQPRAFGAFGANSFGLQAAYKLPLGSVGVAYQDPQGGQKTGLLAQFKVRPIKPILLYGEFGKAAVTGHNDTLLGTAINVDKFSLCGEADFNDPTANNNRSWVAKFDYNFTPAVSAELLKGSATDTTQLKVNYNF
jgi:hypothetical protein